MKRSQTFIYGSAAELRQRNSKWGTSKKHKAPPLQMQLEILAFQDHRCERCGAVLEKDNIEWDHVVPYHIVPTSFFVALCKDCNRAKGGRVLLDPHGP